MLRKTKITCTIGPASQEPEIFEELVRAGLDIARLNFSHGNHEEHRARIKTIKEVREKLGKPVAIMLDTKGPEIRTREFENGLIEVVKGQDFIITSRDILGNKDIGSVTYDGFANDLVINDRILIDDGLIEMIVKEKINATDLRCEVRNGGQIKNKKGVNVPNVKIKLPALTSKDIEDINFGIEEDVDFIAASFIRKADDVIAIRRILEEKNAGHILIMSKIENREGVDNLDEIIKVSDAIMVARGDLGVEIPAEEVPLAQKEMIHKCNILGKPVITATQMLDSMMRNPRPTRAEVSDVATAIFDGSDGIMLSGETAAGLYPIEAVKTMNNIAIMIEKSLDYEKIVESHYDDDNDSITGSISSATCKVALGLNASAIITPTSSGYTAMSVSRVRPKAPIIATTENERVRRKLSLYWGVTSIKTQRAHSTDEIIDNSVSEALNRGMIKAGDIVVITAGVSVGVSGSTNLLKVHVVSELLYKTNGWGNKIVTAKAVKAKDAEELAGKFEDGDIIVMPGTDIDVMDYIERASGIVVEEAGITSHAFIVAMNLNKEAVVGATDCMTKIIDGEILTLNAKQGIVYRGEAKIL